MEIRLVRNHFLAAVLLLFTGCGSTEKPLKTVNIEHETGHVEAAALSAPFSKGVNFSGWFEANSAESINFTKYKEEDFAFIKSIGADVIRLPVKMHSMTGGAPNYTLDPLLLKFLDTAVDWAEKHELYIIIDNHSFDPVLPTVPDIDKILIPVWEQIARRYKDRSNYIVYEILNEPHGISDARWGEVQGMTIDAIRKIDQKHAIIVGGTDYNSIGKLNTIPKYSDPNLIYTFHFYDPHVFTHQGATWGEPSMAPLANIPFPYDSAKMPRFPSTLRGTWLESAFYRYRTDSDPKRMYSTLDRTVAFSKERNVPVFCGEFGVYMVNSQNTDRVRWYEFVTAALDRRNISRTSWDYFGGFGIFKTESGNFEYDLNIDVVKALGFTPPAQKVRVVEPLKTGFVFYDDYPGRQFFISYWGENTNFSLYDTNAADGEFAIRWGNTERYNVFRFDFPYNEDLSELVADYYLEFKARTTYHISFDVRFVNPEAINSIPWRMRHTIDASLLPPDGKWHTIRIPLKDMTEHGAWVSASQSWISPEGKFSWKHIKHFEFVAEHGDLLGRTVYFDSIKVTRSNP